MVLHCSSKCVSIRSLLLCLKVKLLKVRQANEHGDTSLLSDVGGEEGGKLGEGGIRHEGAGGRKVGAGMGHKVGRS